MNKYFAIVPILLIILGIMIWSSWQSTPDFEQYAAGTERKTAFFNYFLPFIEQKNKEILTTRNQLQLWAKDSQNISWWSSREIISLAKQYRVKDFSIDNESSWKELLLKVDVLPPSLVLAQAANESAWGTSRFAKLGNNFFGQWCFKQGCGLVPNKRGAGKAHEVAAFNSPKESLASYMQNLNSHSAYQLLREIRAQQRKKKALITGVVLAAGLSSYSERGEEYIKELREMITYNKLSKYDQNLKNL